MLILSKVIYSVHGVLDLYLILDLDLFQEQAVKRSKWFIKNTLCSLFLIFY